MSSFFGKMHDTRPKPNQPRGHIEILDTTLRDGEQTSGVSFSSAEKLTITRMLLTNLGVPRVEVGSCRVSQGEFDSAKTVCQWAESNGMLSRIEFLGYIDGGRSIDWVCRAGGKVINLLAKGSERHCRLQLGKTPDEHFADVAREIELAQSRGLEVNLYLEDWTTGIRKSKQYVYRMMDTLKGTGVHRFMLADTLGVMNPNQVYEYCKRMVTRYPDVHFDFHAHNDYDLATSNAFAAGLVGIKGLHCTVNGLGERAGNAPLASTVVMVHDMLHMTTGIDEKQIYSVGHVVESFSGVVVAQNEPIVGDNVFTQTAGIHADGDHKNDLYCNDLRPERFGRKREYALGKLSGEASIRENLVDLGIELGKKYLQMVTQRIVQLGDRKEMVTRDDLPYIVSDIVKNDTTTNKVKLINYALSSSKGLRPTASIRLEINGKEYEQTAVGSGQFNAFRAAIRKIYIQKLHRSVPRLTNYVVSIPPHVSGNTMIMTNITWNYDGHVFKTRGIDPDQIEAAIQATIKMLNLLEGEPSTTEP